MPEPRVQWVQLHPLPPCTTGAQRVQSLQKFSGGESPQTPLQGVRGFAMNTACLLQLVTARHWCSEGAVEQV
jgi:hypothetical protein